MSCNTPKEKMLIKEMKDKINDVKEIIELVKRDKSTLLNMKGGNNMKSLYQRSETEVEPNKYLIKLIRKLLIDSYVTKKELLTKNDTLKAIENYTQSVITSIRPIDNSYVIHLMNSPEYGLVYQKVNDEIIAQENPERLMQRSVYVNKIQSFRAKQKPIVYIGNYEVKYHNQQLAKTVERLSIIVSPKYGHINILPRRCFDIAWITEVLSKIPEKVFYVIEEGIGGTEIPIGSHSEKKKMEFWLNTQRVPYDKSMHRSELLQLIEMKKKTMITETEIMAKSIGSDAVIFKKNISLPNYIEKLYDVMLDPKWKVNIIRQQVELHGIESTSAFLNALPMEIWKEVEEQLILEEQKILEEDKIMENNLDELLKGTKPEICKDVNHFIFGVH